MQLYFATLQIHLKSVVFHPFVDRSPAELSDEDDIREDPDFSSNDDMSDVDPLPGDDDRPVHHPRKIHTLGSTFTSRVSCLLFLYLLI